MHLLDIDTEIKADYDLCINQPVEYQKKVDSISKLLSLTGKNKLNGDNCAAYVVGKPESPYVMFSINPGYIQAWNRNEDKEARTSWDVYQKFFLNFFKHNYSEDSQFYRALGKLFCGLTNMKDKWECFDSCLVNLQLIPYHSEGIQLPTTKLSDTQLPYLNSRFNSNLEFVRKFRRKLLIFNGKIFHTLLTYNKFIKKDTLKINIIKNFNIHLFEIDNIPCVLFDMFLSAGHFEGLTNDHMYTTIPNLIRERYEEIKL